MLHTVIPSAKAVLALRPVLVARIAAATNTDTIVSASPADFRIDAVCKTDVDGIASDAIPYCLDIPNHCTLYLGGLSEAAMERSALSYLYARRHAKKIYFVPWNMRRCAPFPPQSRQCSCFRPADAAQRFYAGCYMKPA